MDQVGFEPTTSADAAAFSRLCSLFTSYLKGAEQVEIDFA
jgi:hypothetical protein